MNFVDISEAQLAGVPMYDIEENQDTISVQCLVQSNPRASVVWRGSGQVQPVSFRETLQFSPALRQNAGIYTCNARNIAGEAAPISFHVDVKRKLCTIFMTSRV